MEKQIIFSGELLITELPREAIEDCSRGGCDATAAVMHWIEKLNFSINHTKRAKFIRGLQEYGAWEKEELEAQSDMDLAEKIFWLACGSFSEYIYCAEGMGKDPFDGNYYEVNCGSDCFYLGA